VNPLEVKYCNTFLFCRIPKTTLCSLTGSEWVREDVIYLKNIHLPRLQSIDPSIDLTYLQESGEQWLRKRQYSIDTLTKNLSHDELVSMDKEVSHERYQPNIQGNFYSLTPV